MKKIFGLFVFGILASSAFAEKAEVCLKLSGCKIDVETWTCLECVIKEVSESRNAFVSAHSSCQEEFDICSDKWPNQAVVGVCKNALIECNVISKNMEWKWEKKSI